MLADHATDRTAALAPDSRWRHRIVQLAWGDAILSDAENWYIPDRLTARMRDTLRHTTIPFGAVIAPLRPRRTVIAHSTARYADWVLQLRVVVATDQGIVAEVRERYRRILIAPPGTCP